jgi:Peptidase M10 serralysin C terminal/RTX calcium-binding nonapeptide repeat (4 copies)
MSTMFLNYSASENKLTKNNGKIIMQDVVSARNILGLQSGFKVGQLVTYTFLQSVPNYYDDGETVQGFAPVPNDAAAAFARAISEIQSICNISFVQTVQTESNVGQITFGLRDSSMAYTLAINNGDGGASDIWFPADRPNYSSNYETVLHELMHAIGVSHPVAYDIQDGPIVEFANGDPTNIYTVMSYVSNRYGLDANSLQLYDIGVLQSLFGVNTSTRTGNTVYGGNAGEVLSIWDAGGIDSIRATSSGLENVIIDLRQGYFSSLNANEDASIAFGSEIENAVGSDGDDVIVGNALNNNLQGENGNDYVFADESSLKLASDNYPQGKFFTSEPGEYFLENQNDKSFSINTLIGGEGEDFIYGGAGNDTLYGGNVGSDDDGVKDVLSGGDRFDSYYVGDKDVIIDSDGRGQVRFGNFLLTGGTATSCDAPTSYAGGHGEVYTQNGSSLTVTFTINSIAYSITIEGWDNKELGIELKTIKPSNCGGGGGGGGGSGDGLASPIVLDLDGDGLEITSGRNTAVYFDIDGDGLRELTNWVMPDDGLLAFDANGNGTIDGADELFGYGTSNSIGTSRTLVTGLGLFGGQPADSVLGFNPYELQSYTSG